MTLKRCIALAGALGGVGLLFRLAVWVTAYDNEAQLITNPQLVTVFNLFFLLCSLLSVLYFFFRWPRGAAAPAPYAANGLLPRLLRLGAALCSLASGGLMLAGQTYERTAILLVEGVFLLLQGAALILLTLRQDRESLFYGTVLLFPAFAGCCWLVAFYHQVGGVPNWEVFLWPVAAGIISAACWVSYTGFFYQRQSGRMFGVAAILLMLSTPVAVAAPLTAPWRLSLLGQWMWMFAALLCLKPALLARPVQETPAEETAAPTDESKDEG